MDQTADYRNLEPWMYSVMKKYWAGEKWADSITFENCQDKLLNPRIHGPHAIGKVLIPEKCSICHGAILGYFPSRKEFSELDQTRMFFYQYSVFSNL